MKCLVRSTQLSTLGPALAIGMIGLFVAACASPEQSATAKSRSQTPSPEASTKAVATSSGGFDRVRQTSRGGFYVDIQPTPSPFPLNQLFALSVRVFRDESMTIPAKGVSVVVDAAMPEHHHGMNLTPRVKTVGDGEFRVEGMLFHMPGYWEVYVDVRDQSEPERARFEVNL